MKLTQRQIYSAASPTHLVHIVVTGDTSQNPAGSSYALPLQSIADLATFTSGDFWTSGSTWSGSNYPIKANNDSGLDATGDYSLAEGQNTTALGNSSHAEGNNTLAQGDNSHAEGNYTFSSGSSSHAEGNYTSSIGQYSHSEGSQSVASGTSSHAEGNATFAKGNFSHAEGDNSIASGTSSHAEGYYTTTLGFSSHAEGYLTTSVGNSSHVEGRETTATDEGSHAEGYLTTALGLGSHSEGFNSVASGATSHVEGFTTTARGVGSHAGGANSIAIGVSSFVHGSDSLASGASSTIVLGSNITGTTDNTVYVNLLNIKELSSGSSITNLGIDVVGNVVSGGTGTTYTSDNGLTLTGTNSQLGGSLIQNTTITNNGFDFLVNRGDVGIAIQGTNTTGTGIRGTSSSGAGVVGISSTNNGVSGISTTGLPITATLFSPSASTISPLIRLTNDCTTTSLLGHGGSIEIFLSPVGGGAPIKSGEMQMVWDDFPNSRTEFNILLKDNTGINKKFGISNSGSVTVDSYGQNLHTGTSAYNLAVTASGKMIETGGITGTTPENTSVYVAPLVLTNITTTQRNALTPQNGMLIYNTTDNKFQGYENGSWANLI